MGYGPHIRVLPGNWSFIENRIKLFALGGHSLTQACLIFNTLRDSIKPDDIIILGYADYYNVRHVVAPSHLRSTRDWMLKRDPTSASRSFSIPKASLVSEDKLVFDYIQENCLKNTSYCDKSDPSRSEMTRVTAAIINSIADNTVAKVYILHFQGNPEDPLFKLIRSGPTRVSVLPSDFDYFIRDDVEGFDPHPGPYWHYAISRKLLKILSS